MIIERYKEFFENFVSHKNGVCDWWRIAPKKANDGTVFCLILDSSVGLSAGIQSAEDWVSETLCVRILHSAEEDKLSPFD